MRTRLPWITAVLTVIVVLNPLGLDMIYAAFFSNEALSRGIWAPIMLAGMAILALIGLLEWWIRVSVSKRSRCRAPGLQPEGGLRGEPET